MNVINLKMQVRKTIQENNVCSVRNFKVTYFPLDLLLANTKQDLKKIKCQKAFETKTKNKLNKITDVNYFISDLQITSFI